MDWVIDLLMRRWFGIYAGFVILGALAAWLAWGPAYDGLGVFLAQMLYVVIFMVNRRIRTWAVARWR